MQQFKKGDIVKHLKGGGLYVIVDVPTIGMVLEHCNDTFYKYKKIIFVGKTYSVGRKTWHRGKHEMEDGRFMLIVNTCFEDIPQDDKMLFCTSAGFVHNGGIYGKMEISGSYPVKIGGVIDTDGWSNSATVPELQPIETAPKDGRYILLFGPSGYTTTLLHCEVCRWYPEYRPIDPWVTHSNDCFSDGGEAPTHWMPLPEPPK